MNSTTHLQLVREGLYDVEDELRELGLEDSGDLRACALNLMAMQKEAAAQARQGFYEINGQVMAHLMHTCYRGIAQASLVEDTRLSGPLLEKASRLLTTRAVDAYLRALLKDGNRIVEAPSTGAPETYQVAHEVRGADGCWSVLDRAQVRVEPLGPGLFVQAWRRFPAAFIATAVSDRD